MRYFNYSYARGGILFEGCFTMKEARDFHLAHTPRGRMRDDLDLLGFVQLLYMRQPGYGSSYVTGKYLNEQLLGETGSRSDDGIRLSGFFRQVSRPNR